MLGAMLVKNLAVERDTFCLSSACEQPNHATRLDTPQQHRSRKPMARRWSHKLSIEARLRCDSTLKASARQIKTSTFSLGVARPAARFYPWKSIEMEGVDQGEGRGIPGNEKGATMLCTQGEAAYDFSAALNYGDPRGSLQLLQFMHGHIESIHNPSYTDWDVSLTCGTTSALEIVFRMLCNSGSTVLTEQYTYTGAIQAARPLGINVLGVRMDDHGVVPDELDRILRSWRPMNGQKPSVFYTIPTGQNPTGISQPHERRIALYKVAERHDLIIVEDDPYYFLQLCHDQASSGEPGQNVTQHDRYLSRLPASYLSLDRCGRVIRLDTFSKIMAPGLRVGTITACRQLIQKFSEHTNFSTSSPAGPSQAMLYKLLVDTWGQSGFIDWLWHLSSQYRARLCIMVEQCRMHLPAELCSWSEPEYGMFLWVKIRWAIHPKAAGLCYNEGAAAARLDIEDLIYIKAQEYGVQLSKGSWFAVQDESEDPIFFRLTFAAVAHEDDLHEAIRQLGRALRAELEMTSDRQAGFQL